MMIKQPALAPSPQPRPAPTVRALPAELAAQRGPFCMPIRGPNPTPIDTRQQFIQSMGRMSCDTGEDVAEPGLRIDAIHFGRYDETLHARGALSASIGHA